MRDKVKIKILQDGRIVTQTDKISMKNHIEAEEALAELASLLGGLEVKKTSSKTHHDHHHKVEEHHKH